MSPDLFVWVQTSKHRDPSAALANIEASDIGTDYLRIHDDNDWPDFDALQVWWKEQWFSIAEQAKASGCRYVLRLEDDIVVNRHIRHNVLTWPALQQDDFGYGTLFCPDYWGFGGALLQIDKDLTARRGDLSEGAQGQVLKTEHILETIQQTDEARNRDGQIVPLSFDWSVSRAAAQLGRTSYVHLPALVNVTEISLRSSLSRHLPTDTSETHCWGTKQFSPRWKRPTKLPERSCPHPL